MVESRWAIAITVLPAASVCKRQLNLLLRFGIERGGGFVEKKDGRVLQKRARDGEPLLLSAGKQAALVADDGVVPCGCAMMKSCAKAICAAA